jgi:hypothetical protein
VKGKCPSLLFNILTAMPGCELILKYGVTNLSGVPSIALDVMDVLSTASGYHSDSSHSAIHDTICMVDPETRKKLKLAQISTGGAAAPSNAPAEYAGFIKGVVPSVFPAYALSVVSYDYLTAQRSRIWIDGDECHRDEFCGCGL